MNRIHSAGIDKITATTFDFEIEDAYNGKWQVKSNTKLMPDMPENQLIITDRRGNQVRGDYLFHNSKDTGANYTISRIKSGGEVSLSMNCNPSKMAHPYGLAATGSDSFIQSTKRTEAEMYDIGIRTNQSTMKAYRVDVAKQATMSRPFQQYHSAFLMLKGGGRMKRRGFEGGHQFENRKTQCLFYDKVAEMQARDMGQLILDQSNLMRGEIRALDGKSVGRILNISTLSDLFRMDHVQVNEAYKKCMYSRVFGTIYRMEQACINYEDELEMLKACRETLGRGWVMAYFALDGFDKKLSMLGGLDRFRSMLVESGLNRQHSHRVIKQVEQLSRMKAEHDRQRNAITPAMLLDELSTTFLAA